MIQVSALTSIIGKPEDETINVAALVETSDSLTPEIANYPDATYVNYKPLGLSLCYEPAHSSKPKLLAFIDLFNPPPKEARRPRRKEAYEGYATPPLPITFDFLTTTLTLPPPPKPKPGAKLPENIPTTMERPLIFEVGAETTGKDFVSHFGEPTKKGEGQEGYVPPFLEWERVEVADETGKRMEVGVLVELRGGSGAGNAGVEGEAQKGAGIWDRAGDWTWVGLKLFAVA